jgi:hypothetical protein
VTAAPPRTELWGLLYAQVTQADDKDFRNILLDDRQLDWRVQVETEKAVNVLEKYSDSDLQVLSSIAYKNFKYEINASGVTNLLKLANFTTKNKDAKKYGTVVWSQQEVNLLLANMGLPLGSSLSVLVVETMPQISNVFEHISRLDTPQVADGAENLVGAVGRNALKEGGARALALRADAKGPSPVSDELGHHRLLRTSPLTEVPPVCPP